MKRIGIAQIWQESNHFSPLATTLADFEAGGLGVGDAGLARFGGGEEVGGFLAGMRAWNQPAQPMGLLMTQAWSGGPLSNETLEQIKDELESQLAAAKPLDGVLISLHGALVAADELDVDAALLQLVRRSVGDDVPVVATVDLHAYVTPRMLSNANVIVAYHTNPHIDRTQTGERAAAVLQKLLGGARPTGSSVLLPMNCSGDANITHGPVLSPVFEQVQAIEKLPGVLSVAVLMAQPWLDVPNLGWQVIVTTDNDVQLAQTYARQLAEACWPLRTQLIVELQSAGEAIESALATQGKPVVIADGADATNSGAPGDSVHLLREMIARPIEDGGLTFMVDPQAVAHAREVGEGGAFSFAVGGKRDHVFSSPLAVQGRVLFLRDAKYTLTGHLGDNLAIDMGMAAAVRINDVTLLLVERTGPGSSPLTYRCVGLEPTDFKIVIVKSPAGFRAEYEPLAARIILTACPGCAAPRLTDLPYRRVSRPMWPLDEIDNWRAVDWCGETTW